MLFAFGLDFQILDFRHPRQGIPACLEAKRRSQLARGLEESLPRRIEKLRLIRNEKESIPLLLVGLERVTALARTDFPKLQSVIVVDKEDGSDWDEPGTMECAGGIQAMARQYGVEVKLVRG